MQSSVMQAINYILPTSELSTEKELKMKSLRCEQTKKSGKIHQDQKKKSKNETDICIGQGVKINFIIIQGMLK